MRDVSDLAMLGDRYLCFSSVCTKPVTRDMQDSRNSVRMCGSNLNNPFGKCL